MDEWEQGWLKHWSKAGTRGYELPKTGPAAGNVIYILDAENQVCQRTGARAFCRDMSVAAEGSKIVLIKY